MIPHKVFYQYDTIVEVGDMLLLISKGANGAIGKDVIMKIAIEIAREILAGEGEDDLILELGIDRQRATDDLVLIFLVNILQNG